MKPQHIHAFKGTSLGLLCLILSACDTAPTQVDRHFGMAVRQAQTQQAQQPSGMHEQMHPRMSRGMSPDMQNTMKEKMQCSQPMPMPSGMHERHHPQMDSDGVTAQSAIERYQESFQTPPTPAPVFNIGLGAARSR